MYNHPYTPISTKACLSGNRGVSSTTRGLLRSVRRSTAAGRFSSCCSKTCFVAAAELLFKQEKESEKERSVSNLSRNKQNQNHRNKNHNKHSKSNNSNNRSNNNKRKESKITKAIIISIHIIHLKDLFLEDISVSSLELPP